MAIVIVSMRSPFKSGGKLTPSTSRHIKLGAWLGILALLTQLWMPLVHEGPQSQPRLPRVSELGTTDAGSFSAYLAALGSAVFCGNGPSDGGQPDQPAQPHRHDCLLLCHTLQHHDTPVLPAAAAGLARVAQATPYFALGAVFAFSSQAFSPLQARAPPPIA
ncbi:MAG: DUF2946 family protein [Gammaproteobacteria bacterium]